MIEGAKFRAGVARDARCFAELDMLCFPPEVAFHVNTFRYYLLHPHSVSLVCVDMEDSIAAFSIGKLGRGGGSNIITLDVHPDFRRRGLGSTLLVMLEEGLDSMGAKLITLQVAVDNDAAIHLYKKAGYQTASVLPDYYPDSDFSRGIDAYLMFKRFE